LGKVLLATAAMAAMSEVLSRQLNQVILQPDVSVFLILAMVGYAIALATATYFTVAWLLGLPEATTMIDRGMRLARKFPVIGTFFG
jgi:hypothetical protein